MDWRKQLGKDRRGSRPRCLLLVDDNRRVVAERLTRIVRMPDVVIGPLDRWIPCGKPVQLENGSWNNTPAREAKVHELADLLPCNIQRQKEIKEELLNWWLAARRGANTPNWDIASTCTIKGKPGMLLVEAKAHSKELSKSGKELPKASDSDNSRKNHEQISQAIGKANEAFQKVTGKEWNLSSDCHYQLSNRFAWSWKLVSLHIPVVLLYLGFLDADDMTCEGPILECKEHWERELKRYSKGIVDNSCWGEWLDFSGVPFLPLIRACKQSL